MDASSFLHPATALGALNIDEGMHVADFGAGSGHFTLAAARAVGQTGVVWAVDINPDLLTRIKNTAQQEGLTNVEIVRGDVEEERGSQLPENRFDVVIVSNVLFAADDKQALAREVSRVLQSGGRALIIDWRDSFGGLGPHPDHITKIGAARDIFEDAGLEYLLDVPAGKYHWGCIVRKKTSV